MAISTSTKRPLILFAIKEEVLPFRLLAKNHDWRIRPQKDGFILEKGNSIFEVLVCGPGRINVKEALANRRPSQIINPGFAGSINPAFGKGDVVRVSSIRSGSCVCPVDDCEYPDLSSLNPARLVTAPAPLGAQDKMTMHKDDAGDLVDMESFHVQSFCREQAIPYCGIRAVSDSLEDELPDVVKNSFDGRRFKLGQIIRAAIFSRSTRGQLLQLRKDSQEAAEALGRALLANL